MCCHLDVDVICLCRYHDHDSLVVVHIVSLLIELRLNHMFSYDTTGTVFLITMTPSVTVFLDLDSALVR